MAPKNKRKYDRIEKLLSSILNDNGDEFEMQELVSLTANFSGCLRLAAVGSLLYRYQKLKLPAARSKLWRKMLRELGGAQTEVSRFKASMDVGGAGVQ
jgi:hypothetical protein